MGANKYPNPRKRGYRIFAIRRNVGNIRRRRLLAVTKDNPGREALATERNAPARAPEAMGPPAVGFAVRLEGATIHDLVQLECLQRAPKIIRVRAGVRTGMLFFREGQVVHAAVGNAVGELAFRDILGWPGGTFETWHTAWPAIETIALPWQHLLLRAAHADDERRRGPKLLSFPVHDAFAATPHKLADAAATAPIPAHAPMPAHAPISAAVSRDVSIRLRADGHIVEGSQSPQLAEAVAYSAQLADRIGELLGLEPFTRIDLALSTQTACLIRRQQNGDLVALKAAGPAGTLVEPPPASRA